ncbi:MULTISPECIES: ACP S-malonyltransferase [Thermotoga]|uniref:Malonyl CoA-acyl carrier protein transacylase n=3 Tax=Thermotoga petrophila TaxID=93929 RepID=A5IIY6_THEP1|nr:MULTISPECIES: ACP S-malonyltransferase [Thermotoga]KUK23670.1 MAG: Malonyl CoA-acyl carrier protein transacylase [Thermotoga petrophila]MBZ4660973.1 malonyl CoA-acyl carrier protein transacylase [Thermotoga sp.]ABQ46159.1 [Acyl-carrier-protein] S-malonyltransferase [Thermotoga petrophila RKU-1]ACB08490.1 malonyl CoA-acyl carrier protein transacylase [Thermotoga sp. RQ2]ADA66236.1 malonyl CoA-acyl carrier protein transacylase [Thermotoga petrophila RKU-10]
MKAFVFPGQGSQYSGMAKDFSVYESSKEIFERAKKVLGFDITEIMNGDEETLKLTENAQPSIYITSYIAFLELEKRGILPDVVAGHSLGEYTALAVAGVYDFETGLYLVRKRGEYMSKALEPGKGTMAAVIGLNIENIEEVVNSIEGVYIANYNSHDQVVISGLKESVEKAMEILKDKGARRVVELMVSSPFHTPFLEYAREKMKEEVEKVDFKKPRWPIVMNSTAKPTENPEEIKRNIIEQITGPVLWKQSVDTMKEMGVTEFIEVGPKTVLKNLCRRMGANAKHFTEILSE